MANGNFEQHVAELIAARARGIHHADLVFADMAQEGHWTSAYARKVWDASRPPPPPPKAPRPPGVAANEYEDDIPF
jgi:hypothetical protein